MKYHTIILAIATLVACANVAHAQAAQNLPSDVSRVIAQRDAEIKKINQRCVTELEKLKVSYTKRGDLKNALLVDNLIKEMKLSPPIVGNWMFDYKGKSLRYTFREDGSMSGAYVISGSGFKGTWKEKGDNVEISSDRGEIIANVSMTAAGRPEMKTVRYNIVLPGKKID